MPQTFFRALVCLAFIGFNVPATPVGAASNEATKTQQRTDERGKYVTITCSSPVFDRVTAGAGYSFVPISAPAAGVARGAFIETVEGPATYEGATWRKVYYGGAFATRYAGWMPERCVNGTPPVRTATVACEQTMEYFTTAEGGLSPTNAVGRGRRLNLRDGPPQTYGGTNYLAVYDSNWVLIVASCLNVPATRARIRTSN